MTTLSGLQFSREWGAAWNARDVEAVLAHSHDDVLFVSHVAQKIGVRRDRPRKDARYWRTALAIS